VLLPLLTSLTSLTFASTLVQRGELGAGIELDPGAYAVGFRSHWELDEGRAYRTAFDEGATYGAPRAPRPVLVNLWYPARATIGARPMSHGDYFEIDPGDGALVPLAQALSAFAQDILAEETLGQPVGDLDESALALWHELLETPTRALRDAQPAEGGFPLVVAHSGARSSFEDNALLCEWLASHGYVVIGSAFLDADGEDLAVDGGEASIGDVEHLLRYARTLPFVDHGKVGFVGHSLGAQAGLRQAAGPNCALDALVLLDTTQDYYTLGMPLHRPLIERVSEHAQRVTQAVLVAAGPEAVFQLLDTLTGADRTYLTVPALDHNEFIAQGFQRLSVLARQSPPGSVEIERVARLRAYHAGLCLVVLAFLDAELRAEPESFLDLIDRHGASLLGDGELHVERAPRGTSGPPPFDPLSDPADALPPTPRQILALLAQAGPEVTATVLERWHGVEPPSPIYDSTMFAGSLLHELAQAGDAAAARAFCKRLLVLQPAALDLFSSFGGFFEERRPPLALEFLRAASFYDPENAELAGRVRRLEAGIGRQPLSSTVVPRAEESD
jgi:hypothetical protein